MAADGGMDRDFSMLQLKEDHSLRPLWVCPDKKIFLETFSPFYQQAYDFLIAIAEPVCRPELIHEYKITAYSLYAAVSVGLRTDDIISGLNRLSKNVLEDEFLDWLKDNTEKCGKLKLVLKKGRYFLESTEESILTQLLHNDIIYSCRAEPSADMTYNENGLIVERFVHENRGQFAGKDNNKDKDCKESKESKESKKKDENENELEDDIDLTENDKKKNDNNNNNNIGNIEIEDDKPHVEDIVSFEIQASQIEKVKETCQRIGFPCVEEYDFRGDKQTPTIDMALKPIAKHRPYQEKSLSKMFGNGRARSGIIVLPCGAGKTLTGITAVATVKKSCIIFCNTTVSVHQWFHQILHWAKINRRQVLEFSSQKKDAIPTDPKQAVILVTTYYMFGDSGRTRSKATKAVMDAIKQREWGLLVLDEVHIAPAKTFRQVTTQVKSRTKLGLTATLLREDAKIEDLYYLIGPKLYEANWLDLQKAGYLAKVQCVEVWAQMTQKFYHWYLKTRNKQVEGVSKRGAQLLSDFNPNKLRCMEYLINVHTQRGDKVLVFSDNIELLKHCATTLKKPQIYGETKDVERKYWLHRFNHTNSVNCLFISSVGDTSIDLPDVNVVVQISSHYGSRRQEAQRLGRILRPKPRQGDEFNAFFYTIVSKDTVDMVYATKRQRFLVDQGYSFHVITDLISDSSVNLHYSKEEEQTQLLQYVLSLVNGKRSINEQKYANEDSYAQADDAYHTESEGNDDSDDDDDDNDNDNDNNNSGNKPKVKKSGKNKRGSNGAARVSNSSMNKWSGAGGEYNEFESSSRGRGRGNGSRGGRGRGRGRGNGRNSSATGHKRKPASDFFKKEAKRQATLAETKRAFLPQ